MKQRTQDLGQVAAMYTGDSPPTNTTMIWFDTTTRKHRAFDFTSQTWALFGGGSSYVLDRPTVRQIGEIPAGTTFNGTVQDVLDKLLKGNTPPGSSISVTNPVREFGSPGATTVTWSVTPGTELITGITVAGQVVTATGGAQGGTLARTASSTADTTYGLAVTATTLSGGASATVSILHRSFVLYSAGNLDAMGDGELSALLRGLNTGNDLNSSRSRSREVTTNVSAQYLYYAYAAVFDGGGAVPNVTVNGLPNTSYTKKSFTYTNAQGAAAGFILVKSGELVGPGLNVKFN